jgi:YfiH family protein
LNLAAHVGDDPAAVASNRRAVREALELPVSPSWLNQVHGRHVLHLEGADEPAAAADAAVSDGGSVAAVMVADCLPVLFAARSGTAVAAAHAGWRGLAAGVLEATVAALAPPAHELLAWLGPAIGAAHFEVGAEVRAAFVAQDDAAAAAFTANARGRWQCDLRALARQRLRALGLRSIYSADACTYADTERCYSYRRDGVTGRMAALIWLR